MKNGNYYLGLDIGTNSVGYAATDTEYNLLKYHGEPVWGVHLFEEASLKADRRGFRTARRRLDRRQQRVTLIQELFAKEVAAVDPDFYKRISESRLYRDETDADYTLFCDPDYTDKDYHKHYPTIHHLIYELMTDSRPHDVRLVYLACAWLVAHRGHFLNQVDKDKINEVTDFGRVYSEFEDYFNISGYEKPWEIEDTDKIKDILKNERGVKRKTDAFHTLLNGGKKFKDDPENDSFPFSREAIVKLICGGKVSAKDLFMNDDFADVGSIALYNEDEVIAEFMANVDENSDIITALKKVYDWSVLSNSLMGKNTMSEAKKEQYKRHKEDLQFLKYFVKKYCKEKYDEIFRDTSKKDNKLSYSAYVYHSDEGTGNFKKLKKDDFLPELKKFAGEYADKIKDEDKEKYDDMMARLESLEFLPKQKNGDNRVIPYQLYWHELKVLLDTAKGYLPFLDEKDEDGLTTAEKILSVFEFRIPYYVGPLNENSSHAWIERKGEGKIYPWNFDKLVDLDKSEDEFIRRMTATCTYLPGEKVLPKASLLYHKFMVLNEINPLTIDGRPISVELKQAIYNDLFKKHRKVKRKSIIEYLVSRGYLEKDKAELVGGIDININADLSTYHIFKNMIDSGKLTEDQVETIIERGTYSEDSLRFRKWIAENYPDLTEEDAKYISRQKFKDFGRFSKKFLFEIEGADRHTGEVYTIIGALWNTNNNLMKLLAEDDFTFNEVIKGFSKDYYAANSKTLADRMDEMYLSNSVRRCIYRTLDVVKDVVKAKGAPKKIFVEMARGGGEKGKRTKSRKDQILEFYSTLKGNNEAARLKKELEEMGVKADSKLQSDRLFLYFIQLGKCMYSGQPIDIQDVFGNKYNIEHIYPQSLVKDDSVINNKVLVLSEINGLKSDEYPVPTDIRARMQSTWHMLKNNGMMSEEKYKRLTRSTRFTDEEKTGFINRQLVETRQTTKAIATLLKENYPETEIVYSKAGLVSDFRQEFDMLKSRSVNDLHHAKDAFLNIVVGNVYNMRFTKKWFNVNEDKYSVRVDTIFGNKVTCGGETVWNGSADVARIKKTMQKNNIHLTEYAFCRKGGLFDQMPVKKGSDLIELKKGLNTEKYGGYNKAGVSFYHLVKCKLKGKSDILFVPVELLGAETIGDDKSAIEAYVTEMIERISGQKPTDISFPVGYRKIMINTRFRLNDALDVSVSGKAMKGKRVMLTLLNPLNLSYENEFYIKKLEVFNEKLKSTKDKYYYDEEKDIVSSEKNKEIYDLFLDKLDKTIYSFRMGNPIETLKKGREEFQELDIKSQTKSLMSILSVFGRLKGSVDLTLIGGKGQTATTYASYSLASWGYNCVRLVDCDASGLHEKVSENLLDLL